MAEYGRAYLSSGGPTSRLEESLAALGRGIGYPTEVFATPTGIFVSCVDEVGATHTALSRIKDGGVNLGKLCWLEGIFEDVSRRKITVSQGLKVLHGKAIHKAPYKTWQTTAAAFLAGFALSFPRFGRVGAAVASGVIATATWWLSGPGLGKKVTSSIFRDFVGCAATLGLAALCQVFSRAPFEAYSIGGLVILVPGLALTTAIAELADQNLVSGTAKLMQAVLTLLALGLAYMLFQEFTAGLGFAPVSAASAARGLPLGPSAAAAAVSVCCFGIIFRVPPRSLLLATLTGLAGWLTLRQFGSPRAFVAASFTASLLVGLLSLFLGGRFKVPSQVYSVPGILALLPGMLALTSMRRLTSGDQDSAIELASVVAMTAGSIVFGLFTARIPFVLGSRNRY